MKYKLIAFDEKVQILMDPPLTLRFILIGNPKQMNQHTEQATTPALEDIV